VNLVSGLLTVFMPPHEAEHRYEVLAEASFLTPLGQVAFLVYYAYLLQIYNIYSIFTVFVVSVLVKGLKK